MDGDRYTYPSSICSGDYKLPGLSREPCGWRMGFAHRGRQYRVRHIPELHGATMLRPLGVEAEHPVMIQARRLLHRLGGALNAPHWSKFWLAVLGVCDWEIVNPIPPEGLAAARLGAIGPMEMVGAYPTSLPANVVDLVEAMDGPGDGRYQSPTTGVVCSVMGQH